MQYITIEAPVSDAFVERRSRFIGQLFPLEHEVESISCMEEVRRTHPLNCPEKEHVEKYNYMG